MPGNLVIEKLNIDRPFHNIPPVVTQLLFGIVFLIIGWYMPKNFLFAGFLFYFGGFALLVDLFVVRVAGGWNRIMPS